MARAFPLKQTIMNNLYVVLIVIFLLPFAIGFLFFWLQIWNDIFFIVKDFFLTRKARKRYKNKLL